MVDKLREAFAAARRRPVNDTVWQWLTDMGYVEDAEQMSLAQGAQYLKRKWREMQQVVASDSGAPISLEPRDAAFNARGDALAAIFAAWAAHESDVDWFRRDALRRFDAAALTAWARGGPHPGFELLAEDEVAEWILERYNAASETGNGEDYIKKLILGMQFGSESPVVDLQYVDGGSVRILTVPRRGSLGDLARLSEKLAKRYRWHPAWAAQFVLTGAEPVVSTFSASAEVRYGTGDAATTRVTLSLDPFLPVERVAELYAALRARLEPQPARRAQSLRAYRLAEHVGPHVTLYPTSATPQGRRGRPRRTDPPGGLVWYIDPVGGHTWSSLRRSWNNRYTDCGEDGTSWIYSELSNFTTEAQDVLKRLLDPQWSLRDLPSREGAAAIDLEVRRDA